MSADSQTPLYRTKFSAFDNKTLEQRIQELADRDEIRELTARYAHSVAHRTSVADLFTDDGAFIIRMPGQPVHESRGREQLVKEYAKLEVSADPALPMIHNHVIAISGDEGQGICSVEIRVADNGKSMIASGYYEDSFRRENGHWKFVVRDVTIFHWVPIQEGWAKTAK
jgi:hypothetical protein